MSTAATPAAKKDLRKALCNARRALTRSEARHASLRLRRLALQAGWLWRGRRFAFYLPQGGEMDLLPLLNTALQRGKECYLPVVPRRLGKPMRFARLGARRHWYHNRFGIPENHDPRPKPARDLDVMFMPLVGFDLAGNRLGMGGGFYDATLAFLRSRKTWRKPILIGTAYELQKTASVPRQPWDVKLDFVVTERRVYRVRESND